MLLNHSREGDAVWKSSTAALTILQDIGSDGTIGSLHRGRTPGEEDTGGGHIVWTDLHFTRRISRNCMGGTED